MAARGGGGAGGMCGGALMVGLRWVGFCWLRGRQESWKAACSPHHPVRTALQALHPALHASDAHPSTSTLTLRFCTLNYPPTRARSTTHPPSLTNRCVPMQLGRSRRGQRAAALRRDRRQVPPQAGCGGGDRLADRQRARRHEQGEPAERSRVCCTMGQGERGRSFLLPRRFRRVLGPWDAVTY